MQAAQSVIGRCALFDEALPRAVQAQDDLLVFFFDGDKAHRGPGGGLGDGGGVSGVVPQGQASRFLPRLPPIRYGVTNFGAISSTVWPCRRNSRAQWCAPEQASMPIGHGGKLAMSGSSRSRAGLGLTRSALPS